MGWFKDAIDDMKAKQQQAADYHVFVGNEEDEWSVALTVETTVGNLTILCTDEMEQLRIKVGDSTFYKNFLWGSLDAGDFQILDLFSYAYDNELRRIAALNGNHQVHVRMPKDPNTRVREAVAKKTSNGNLLDELSYDGSAKVVRRVVQNRKTHLETLERLTRHSNEGIQKAAQKAFEKKSRRTQAR